MIRIPFVAGTPGLPFQISDTAIYFDGASPMLGMSGIDGLVVVDIDAAFALYD